MICPVCGREFVQKAHAQKYCSKECRGRSWYRRKKLREEMPELPVRANDMYDAVSNLWHAANALGELSRASDPATAALAGRLASAVWRALDEEGLR